MKKWRVFVIGFFMGIADSIPGISGGTVAFITGIYERWISAFSAFNFQFIKYIVKLRIREALSHIDFYFLLTLYAGVAAGFIPAIKTIAVMLRTNPLVLLGFFTGLILASGIDLSIKYLKEYKSNTPFKGILIYLPGVVTGIIVVNLPSFVLPEGLLYTFIAGWMAICAMLLPGISGSYILLIAGKYSFMIGILENFFLIFKLVLSGKLNELKTQDIYFTLGHLFSFIVGLIAGLLSFSQLLKRLINKYHALFGLFFSGFVIGTVSRIYPWHEDSHKFEFTSPVLPWQTDYDPQILAVSAAFLVGAILYIVLEKREKLWKIFQ